MQDPSEAETPGSGVLQKSITSGKWLTAGYIIQRGISLVSFFILARLLTPADFGIVAYVLLVPKFLQATTETGFSSAAIQKDGDIKRYLNPIWTVGVIKGFVIALLIFAIGPLIARGLNVEGAGLAIRLGGLFILVNELANVGELYFFKNLDFKKVFWRNLVRQIAYVVVSLAAIRVTPTYWALLWGTLAMYLIEAISTYWLHPYRPRLSFQFGALRELFGYGKWMVGQGWLGQGYAFFEAATVGRLTSATAFGLYTKAKSVASIVPGFLSSVITMVSFPAYAKLKDDADKVRDGLSKSFDLLFALVIPTAFLVVAAGGKLILIFLGPAWLPMTDTFRILLFFFILHTVIDLSYALFNGIGRPDKNVKYEMVKIPLTLILIYFLTVRFGIAGAAAAMILGATPILFVVLRDLKRLAGLSYGAIMMMVLTPLAVSILLALPLIVFKNAIIPLGGVFFVGLLAALGFAYLAILYALGRYWNIGPYKTLKLVLRYII